MNRRTGLISLVALPMLLLAGCLPLTPVPNSHTPEASPSSSGPASDGDETAPPEAGDNVISSKLGCDWRIPSSTVVCSVSHPMTPPIAAPPVPPVPYLYAIGEGTHPDNSPPYDQLSFRFKGGFPSYSIDYVNQLAMDGSGSPVPLPGAGSIVRVVFRDAQAHDENGESTVVSAPPTTIGHQAISRWASAGDFEGTLTFGIGIGGSGDVGIRVPLRVYEVEKIELGQHLYVVAIQMDQSHWR